MQNYKLSYAREVFLLADAENTEVFSIPIFEAKPIFDGYNAYIQDIRDRKQYAIRAFGSDDPATIFSNLYRAIHNSPPPPVPQENPVESFVNWYTPSLAAGTQCGVKFGNYSAQGAIENGEAQKIIENFLSGFFFNQVSVSITQTKAGAPANIQILVLSYFAPQTFILTIETDGNVSEYIFQED